MNKKDVKKILKECEEKGIPFLDDMSVEITQKKRVFKYEPSGKENYVREKVH